MEALTLGRQRLRHQAPRFPGRARPGGEPALAQARDGGDQAPGQRAREAEPLHQAHVRPLPLGGGRGPPARDARGPAPRAARSARSPCSCPTCAASRPWPTATRRSRWCACSTTTWAPWPTSSSPTRAPSTSSSATPSSPSSARPERRADDAARACACAIAMQVAMKEVNAFNRSEGLPEVEMGIAVNTGQVIVGNIGSQTRAKYGVVGSHVNLAGRMEGFTVGGQVLVSASTVDKAGAALELGQTRDLPGQGLQGAGRRLRPRRRGRPVERPPARARRPSASRCSRRCR